MSGRCRVDQCDRDVPGVPILDVGTALDVPDFDLQLRQMVDDTLPVMLKPVSYQHRLSVGGFDQVFESFQLRYVAKGLVLDAEKNASAPLPNGTSAGATATAKPARARARTARRG